VMDTGSARFRAGGKSFAQRNLFHAAYIHGAVGSVRKPGPDTSLVPGLDRREKPDE